MRRFDTVETGSSARSEVKALCTDTDGRMFIAGRDAVVDVRSVSSGKLLSSMSLPSPAYSLWWDSIGHRLWIGTRKNGLFVDVDRFLFLLTVLCLLLLFLPCAPTAKAVVGLALSIRDSL